MSEPISDPPVLRSTVGMVTANHVLAARAGAAILSQGGNAMDAAIATSAALGVVEPAMSGLGGRGYLVVHSSDTGVTEAIEGNSRAPGAARPDMFAVESATPVERTGWGRVISVIADANADGHRAVAAPTLAGALAVAHQRHGTLAVEKLLAPAIELAERGFAVSVSLAKLIARHREKLARYPATAAIFLRADRSGLRAGDLLTQADLGSTYRALGASGFSELMVGSLAQAIVSEVRTGGGVLELSDLRDPATRVWPDPLLGTYRGHKIFGIPELTGGLTLVQIMNILEGFDLRDVGSSSARTLHLLVEASRIAFTDRSAYLEDPAFAQVPFAGLGSKDFAATRRATLSEEHALDHVEPGDAWTFDGPGRPAEGKRSPGAVPADTHTSHFCVVDRNRMVVSMTQSIIDPFGSGVVVPGTGVLLNSAMHNFVPLPGTRGSIAPGKRSAHFGCPTLIVGPSAQTTIAIGGGGGTKIVTGIAQSLVAMLDEGVSPQRAIQLPRVHNDGSSSQVDADLAGSTVSALRGLGHELEVVRSGAGEPAFARINAIRIDAVSRTAIGGVDRFSDAGAAAPM